MLQNRGKLPFQHCLATDAKMKSVITLFRPIEFSNKLHKIKSGWSIVYIEGPQVIISEKKHCISFYGYRFCLSKQCTSIKCRIMRHFIWVFTLCQSTSLGVSSFRRVKKASEGKTAVACLIQVYFAMILLVYCGI